VQVHCDCDTVTVTDKLLKLDDIRVTHLKSLRPRPSLSVSGQLRRPSLGLKVTVMDCDSVTIPGSLKRFPSCVENEKRTMTRRRFWFFLEKTNMAHTIGT
jgi:hypothetical protein